MKRIFYSLLACVCLFTGCNKGRTYFPKNIEPETIEIVRFDKALMNVQSDNVQGTKEDIKVLYDEYPAFMPLWWKIF